MGMRIPLQSALIASAALGLCCVSYLAMIRSEHFPLAAMSSSGSDDAVLRPRTTVTPISCERLPHVPGKSVTTALVAFPPNAYSPRHRHPGSVTAYVLKGSLHSQLMGEPVETYTAGQSWFEPPGAIHLFAENASTTEPAELLAIFIADNDCGALVIPDRGDE